MLKQNKFSLLAPQIVSLLAVLLALTACGELATSSPVGAASQATALASTIAATSPPTPTTAIGSLTPTLFNPNNLTATPTQPLPTATFAPLTPGETRPVTVATTPLVPKPLPTPNLALLPPTFAGTTVTTLTPSKTLTTSVLTTLAWSPDGKFLATSRAFRSFTKDEYEAGEIELWDSNGQFLGSFGEALPVRNKGLSWSPDGKVLAYAASDHTIRLWEINSGKPGKLLQVLTGHSQLVTALAWSPDGTLLASGSADSTVRLWLRSSGKEQAVLRGHTGLISRLIWSPDGISLASVSSVRANLPQNQQDNTIRLWDANGNLLKVITGLKDSWFIDMGLSPDGRILAASDFVSSQIFFWNNAGEPLVHFWAGQEETQQLSWSPDGKKLASCGGDELTRIWNWQAVQTAELRDPAGGNVCNVAWFPDSQTLAAVSNSVIKLWSADGRLILTLPSGNKSEVYPLFLEWSADGKRLAASYSDGSVQIWK